MKSQSIIFQHVLAPGDVLVMTAAIRDLHRCYPGRFETAVRTTASDIWLNNPYIERHLDKNAKTIRLNYDLIHRSNQSQLHFIQGFIEDINKKLKLNVRLTEFRPDVHWSDEELNRPLVRGGDYWVILSGGKADFTTKWWDVARYQEVVDRLYGKVRFVQIGNRPDGGGAMHYHPSLQNVINLVGRTTLRQAMRIILHARGVVTPVTWVMHMAAAIAKPAVVIAGGREHYTWEAYTLETLQRNMAFSSGMVKTPPGLPSAWGDWRPASDSQFVDHPFTPHEFLHTIGKLKCCSHGGCWKSRVVEGEPGKNCVDVVLKPGCTPLPRCMDMITVDQVVDAVSRYEQMLDENGQPRTVSQLTVDLPNVTDPAIPQRPNPILQPPKRVVDKRPPVRPVVRPPVRPVVRKPPERPVTRPPVRDIKRAPFKPVVKQPAKSPVSAAEFYANIPMPPTGLKRLDPTELRFKFLTFPITICVLTYGDYGKLVMRCLDSIYSMTDPSLFRLRMGMNEPSENAERMVNSFLADKTNVDLVIVKRPQVYKYPMMRQMFYDPSNPIQTDWICWFDDDIYVENPNWILNAGRKIDENFKKTNNIATHGHHMYGKKFYIHIRGNQEKWIQEAKWYGGRPLRVDNSKRPPMKKIDFCAGAFWLLSREAAIACDWPDERVTHNGGDVMSGEAMYQKGYGIIQSYEGIKIARHPRRGFREALVGART